jgi:hypothetical protein
VARPFRGPASGKQFLEVTPPVVVRPRARAAPGLQGDVRRIGGYVERVVLARVAHVDHWIIDGNKTVVFV